MSGTDGVRIPSGSIDDSITRSGLPRVLRIVTRLNVGGPAQQALLLTKSLPGYATVLVAGTPPAHEGEMTDPAVNIVRAPLVRPLDPRADLRSFLILRNMISEVRPALVHTHMAKAGAIGRSAALLSRERPRLIHTFHGHVLDGYFTKGKQRAFVEVERRLGQRTDMLIAVSEEIREALLDLRIGEPDKIRVVPLGLPLERFSGSHVDGRLRSALGISDDARLIGVIARLVPIKDHPTLLRAMSELPGVHLAVLGDGENRTELVRLTAELGLTDRVHFTGWWPEVETAMADLDVVVLTSRNEGTPVSLIEALAAGRPVVATDVGGVRTVVRHERSGLLARSGDVTGIAVAIRRLLNERDFAQRMAAAGRDDVLQRFGAGRLVGEVRELYDEVLAIPR